VSYGFGDRIDLDVVDVAHGSVSRLLVVTGAENLAPYPSWAPASDRILFRQARGSRSILRTIQTSVAAEPADVITGTLVARSCLEPDGRHLVYTVDDEAGRAVIHRVAVDSTSKPTGTPVRLAGPTSSESRFDVAAQGDFLAYVLLQRDGVDVFVSPLDGTTRLQVSSGGGDQPVWSRTGDRLFYVAGDDLVEVEVRRGASPSLGTPRRLFSLAERGLQRGAGFDVAADGRFLMVRASEPKRIVVVLNGTNLFAASRP
jgi:Tol biopolymer transport system component